jgi:hypothetical protein
MILSIIDFYNSELLIQYQEPVNFPFSKSKLCMNEVSDSNSEKSM